MERESLNFYLQQADPEALSEVCRRIETHSTVTLLQEPTLQTLLLPVADPVTEGSFFAGEVLVTSAIVQVADCKGWAMVMDEAPELARCVATLDAAFAAGMERQAVIALVEDGQNRHAQKTRELASQVEATRVRFDLM
jgi:alpha-D-ribose 1-methylphosphonate 5-triphosphate synthase subunit PhnG